MPCEICADHGKVYIQLEFGIEIRPCPWCVTKMNIDERIEELRKGLAEGAEKYEAVLSTQ